MPTPALRFTPSLRRALCAALVAAGTTGAIAAPDASSDAVNRFLVEKGFVNAADTPATAPKPASADEDNPFVRRVRDQASDMVLTAMNFLGVPYRRGGTAEDKGFDCSGFTRHIFGLSLGLVLPHRADEQARAPGLIAIKRDELKPGDLVFFNTLKRTFSHVGIYVGEGKFIHAPRPGGEVRVEDMDFAYWKKRFTGARRAEPLTDDASALTPEVKQPAVPLPSVR